MSNRGKAHSGARPRGKTPLRANAYEHTSGAKADHVNCGNNHLVYFGNLNVIIQQDAEFWIAQGLQIDYTSQGTSLEDAKKNFEDGLAETIHQNLKINGHIEKMLISAPDEILRDAYKNRSLLRSVDCISFHKILLEKDSGAAREMPFEGIAFMEKVAA